MKKWKILCTLIFATICTFSCQGKSDTTETATACRANADCAAGMICEKGACIVSTTANTACQANTDCPSGQTCQGGTCATAIITSCAKDADCTVAGQICQNNTCIDGPTTKYPPSVTITSPASGSMVSGSVTISVTAQSNPATIGMAVVKLFINGILAAEKTGPFDFIVDSTTLPEDKNADFKLNGCDKENQCADSALVTLLINNQAPAPYCGDGTCNGGETYATCPTDACAAPTVNSAVLSFVSASAPLENGYLLVPAQYNGANPSYYQVEVIAKDAGNNSIAGISCTLAFGDATIASGTNLGGNKFQIVTLKDWFNSSTEPITTVKATCQGVDSNIINLKSVINLAKWLGVANSDKWDLFFGTGEYIYFFQQDGRNFSANSGCFTGNVNNASIYIEGRASCGSCLTIVNGSITNRNRLDGTAQHDISSCGDNNSGVFSGDRWWGNVPLP